MADGITPGSSSLVTLRLDGSSDWTLTMQGLLEGERIANLPRSASEEIIRYREFYRRVMNGFHLSRSADGSDELFKVNALAWWYTHNMFVHYSSPWFGAVRRCGLGNTGRLPGTCRVFYGHAEI